jgi:hypothetical protein
MFVGGVRGHPKRERAMAKSWRALDSRSIYLLI